MALKTLLSQTVLNNSQKSKVAWTGLNLLWMAWWNRIVRSWRRPMFPLPDPSIFVDDLKKKIKKEHHFSEV